MKIKIKDKDIITFYGITWNDGWEFDAPSIITSPGYFYSESYAGLDGLIEDICITLACLDENDELEDESLNSLEWRDWGVEQFDKFIKDSFDEIPTILPDYFQEFKKEIEYVWIIKKTVQFIWNEKEDYYDSIDISTVEKSVDL